MALPQITLTGTVVDETVELRHTGGGTPVVQFRVACNKQVQDPVTKEWRDGDVCFLNVEAWRNRAENAAATLRRGVVVTVVGELRERAFETREGDKRKVYEVINAAVSVDLAHQVAQVEKRSAGGGGRRPAGPATGSGAGPAEPRTPSTTGPAAPSGPAAPAGPSVPRPAGGAAAVPSYEEPPF